MHRMYIVMTLILGFYRPQLQHRLMATTKLCKCSIQCFCALALEQY